MRMKRVGWVVMFTWWLGAAAAQTNSVTDVVSRPAVDLAQADLCLTNLEQLVTKITELERQMAVTNQTVDAECVRTRLARLQVLNNIAGNSRQALELMDLDEAQNDSEVAGHYSQILLACQRAQQLAAEAERCAEKTARQTPRASPSKLKKTASHPVMPQYAPRAIPRLAVTRNRQTCLRQGPLAVLISKAMELPVGEANSASACIDKLTAAGIAPLDGWERAQCATVDDLCVVLAQVMKLEIPDPEEPSVYWQALRTHGIAVDTLLPEHIPKVPSPPLLKSEAIAILSTGIAGVTQGF